MVAAPSTKEHQRHLHLGDTQEQLTPKSPTRMQDVWVMGYTGEGKPLSPESPCGLEEVGLLSASGSIALDNNKQSPNKFFF